MRDLTKEETEFLLKVLYTMDEAVSITYKRLVEEKPDLGEDADPETALYKVAVFVEALSKNPQKLRDVGFFELEVILRTIEEGIPDDLPPQLWEKELPAEVFSLIVLISQEILDKGESTMINLN